MTNETLKNLADRASRVQMTADEKEAQRRSFAYGNANIENPAVTREVVDQAASELAKNSAQDRR